MCHIQFIKKHHLLYPVSANILIRGELNECMIKNAEFNPMQLNHNQRQRRDSSDSSSIADMFVRYTPEVNRLLILCVNKKHLRFINSTVTMIKFAALRLSAKLRV